MTAKEIKERKEYEALKKTVKKFTSDTVEYMKENTIKSRSFLCSAYLLKYIYSKDSSAWERFKAIYEELSLAEQLQVRANVYSNLIEQGKKKIK